MSRDIVITLTGPDRVGIVEELTSLLLGLDCNIERSMAAHLSGEFAVLMLVSMDEGRLGALDAALHGLTDEGYEVTYSQTAKEAESREGWRTYRVIVSGADHEGIVHEFAHGLAQRGVNIESMETWTTPASTSGTLLFSMNAEVAVGPELLDSEWIADLEQAARWANVDLDVEEE